MLSNKMIAEINDQIAYELESAYIYLGMAAWCETANLEGSAHFFKLQAKEETEHAMKFFGYVCECGGSVELKAIAAPSVKYASLLDAFEKTLAHEQSVTKRINKLMDLAIAEKDHLSTAFFKWFIEEQLEEESTAEKIINQLKMIGSSGSGLLMLDHRLAKRGAED